MLSLTVKMEGDGSWPDLKDKEFITIEKGLEVTILDGGMSSGKPSVAIRFELPDGTPVIAQTSARLFCTAAKAFMAKYPDLFDDEPRGGMPFGGQSL